MPSSLLSQPRTKAGRAWNNLRRGGLLQAPSRPRWHRSMTGPAPPSLTVVPGHSFVGPVARSPAGNTRSSRRREINTGPPAEISRAALFCIGPPSKQAGLYIWSPFSSHVSFGKNTTSFCPSFFLLPSQPQLLKSSSPFEKISVSSCWVVHHTLLNKPPSPVLVIIYTIFLPSLLDLFSKVFSLVCSLYFFPTSPSTDS